MKTRQSNFELLRIVAMFFIVIGHFMNQGDYYSYAGGGQTNVWDCSQAVHLEFLLTYFYLLAYGLWSIVNLRQEGLLNFT